MVHSPKVSVIMPAYNTEKYIGQAIDSILQQTYNNWELIIVDDGSTDDTFKIALQYARDNSRILVSGNQHSGRGVTRNKCLEKVSGEYIAIMDSDDISVPDRFEKQVFLLEAERDVFVTSGQILSFFDSVNATAPVYSQPTDAEVIRYRFAKGIMAINHCCAMFRTELIDLVGLYEPECLRSQDLEYFMRVSHEYLIKNSSEPLLLYRQHATKITYKQWLEWSAWSAYAKYSAKSKIGLSKEVMDFNDWYASTEQSISAKQMMSYGKFQLKAHLPILAKIYRHFTC